MTHICVMSSHKPIIVYMGGLILGVNTLYRLFCFFKLFPMISKELNLSQSCSRFLASAHYVYDVMWLNPLLTIGNSLKKQKSLYKVLTPSIKPPI